MNELVSVIIPTYGGGAALISAVDSVLAQSYQNVEVIVVDDNGLGTENQLKTADQMKKYQDAINVQYICHDTNQNGSVARNTGMAHAKGNFIALLDDDDIYYPENIQGQINVLANLPETYGFTYCMHDLYRDGQKINKVCSNKSGDLFYDSLIHTVEIPSSSFLIRRSVWEQMEGFDPSFRRHQDWEFIARACKESLAYAVDFVGYRRNLEFRNSPKSPEVAKEFRMYYLNKMEPHMERLTPWQKRNIVVENRLDVALLYLKKKQFSQFLREYYEIAPGKQGVSFIMRRLCIMAMRKIK